MTVAVKEAWPLFLLVTLKEAWTVDLSVPLKKEWVFAFRLSEGGVASVLVSPT